MQRRWVLLYPRTSKHSLLWLVHGLLARLKPEEPLLIRPNRAKIIKITKITPSALYPKKEKISQPKKLHLLYHGSRSNSHPLPVELL